jgi:hypothetical protein
VELGDDGGSLVLILTLTLNLTLESDIRHLVSGIKHPESEIAFRQIYPPIAEADRLSSSRLLATTRLLPINRDLPGRHPSTELALSLSKSLEGSEVWSGIRKRANESLQKHQLFGLNYSVVPVHCF